MYTLTKLTEEEVHDYFDDPQDHGGPLVLAKGYTPTGQPFIFRHVDRHMGDLEIQIDGQRYLFIHPEHEHYNFMIELIKVICEAYSFMLWWKESLQKL